MNITDAYRVLNVSQKDDDETIKKAYRKLMKKYHPDVCNDAKLALEMSQKINEAYELIGNHRHDNSDVCLSDWLSGIIRVTVVCTDLHEKEKSMPTHKGFLSRAFSRERGYYNIWNPELEDYTSLLFSFYDSAREYLSDITFQSSSIFMSSYIRTIQLLASEEYINLESFNLGSYPYSDGWGNRLKESERLNRALAEKNTGASNSLSTGMRFIDNSALIKKHKEKMKEVLSLIEEKYKEGIDENNFFETHFHEGELPNEPMLYSFYLTNNANDLIESSTIAVNLGTNDYDHITPGIATIISKAFKLVFDYNMIDGFCKSKYRTFVAVFEEAKCAIEIKRRKYPNSGKYFHGVKIHIY